MKLVTYRSKKVSEARIGVISNGQIVDIFQLGLEIGFDFPISMLEFPTLPFLNFPASDNLCPPNFFLIIQLNHYPFQ